MASRLTYPDHVVSAIDRYKYLYAALEAVRLKHNTRAGDASDSARGFRASCLGVQTTILDGILNLRPLCGTADWRPRDANDFDPKLVEAKAVGKAAAGAVILKTLTGIDLDMATPLEAGLDPVEDYTSYTEVDPNNRFAYPSTNVVTITGLVGNEAAYVYKDKDAAHFGATFEHLAEYSFNAGSPAVTMWGVANSVARAGTWTQALSTDLQKVAEGYYLVLRNAEGGTDSTGYADGNRARWVTAKRTSETAFQYRIYSDSGRTTLYDTLTVAVASGRRYRYIYAVSSGDGTAGNSTTGTVSNLDLQEASAATPKTWIIMA